MTGCCNDIHLSMDDTFIQWNEILGDPSTSTSLVAFVDGKLAGIEDLINSLIDEKMAGIKDELLQQLKDEVEQLALVIDPYKIVYKDTTVGDVLDLLTGTKFECKLPSYGPYEIGRRFATFTVTWEVNKTPDQIKSITIERIRNSAPIERYVLDPDVKSFDFANVSSDETYRIICEDINGEIATASTEVLFKHRWYYGTNGFKRPSNNIIINWASQLVNKDTVFGKHVFDCQDGVYIYYAFPDDLHLTYDFITNGIRDNDWVMEVRNVTNQYGYVHPYRIYRTNNLLNGYNIYSEVESHDWH